MCSYILIVITSTKFTIKLFSIPKHTKHTLLTDTNRIVPFVKSVLWIRNYIRFFRKTSLLCSFGWLPLLLYERIINYIQFVAFQLVLSILKFLMIRIAKLHSNANGNSHTVRSVPFIIMSLLMLIVIEMLIAVRFATQRENHS
jgi:hypothetical protein